MEVSSIRFEERKLVGIRVIGRRQELSHRVPLAWLDLVRMAPRIANRVDENVYYGVFVDVDHAGDGHYRYWVATEVSSFGERPAELVELTIPAGIFASVTIEGGAERIDQAYVALAQAIAGAGGPAAASGYGFERYDVRRQAPTPPYERFDYDVFRPIEDPLPADRMNLGARRLVPVA